MLRQKHILIPCWFGFVCREVELSGSLGVLAIAFCFCFRRLHGTLPMIYLSHLYKSLLMFGVKNWSRYAMSLIF